MTSAIGRAGEGAIVAIGDAFERHASAAEQVTRGFQPETAAAHVELSPESRDLASAFVQMIDAGASVSAQVTVLQTVDQTAEELTRALDRGDRS